ncbi:MAG TPA: pitrilysin family protein [Chthonomonadaceae bacterium]|nr:pitrilysin family protein [Chthonomonadaceae bacterium]
MRRVVLPNGVRLLLKPEADTEVVAMVAFVRMEADATALDNATGELVAHALFYGSLNRSMDRVARSVAQVGGALETLRTRDYIAITCVTVREQLDEAIYLLCEALKNADFAPDALERARQDIQEERRKRAEDAFETAYAAVRERLSAPPEPDDSALRRVTQARAQDYFARRYLPARTVIAVVGRFRQDAAQHAFDNALFDYARRAVNSPGALSEVKKPDAAPPALVLQTGGNAAYALIGTPAPGVASPDYPAFTVLHALLGGGHAARLFRRLREAQGLGYDVGATYAADRSDPLVAYLQWDARRALPALNAKAAPQPADALKLLQTQLDALWTDPPTDAELTRARNYAIGRDALRHERARDRAFFLGWYETMGLGYAFDAELPRRLAAVTRDDILRAAKTYLTPRAAVLALPKRAESAGE